MENIKNLIKTSTSEISINNFILLYNSLKEINDKEKYKKHKDDIIEIIQLVIDYLIYGDSKKEQIYFENFCELDFMKEFIKASKSNMMEILLQIIKSMSALILTLTNKISLFYIFSNNFINNIISTENLETANEDFVSFYANFLKSLSLKIDSTTVQLFFQKEKNSFPLLENAIKLYNNEDPMIRNVVRNIYLKFAKLSIDNADLKNYLLSLPMLKYFVFISCRLTDMTEQLNYLGGYPQLYNFNDVNKKFVYSYDKFKQVHDDLIDEIFYLQDMLTIEDNEIVSAFINSLLYFYICPLLLGSILNYKYLKKKKKNEIKYMVSPVIAIYMFTLIISNIHNDILLNLICTLLFKKEINYNIITDFVNIHFTKNWPIPPSDYSFCSSEPSKKLTFLKYITYNFSDKFICSLLLQQNPKFKNISEIMKKYEKTSKESNFDPYDNYDNILTDIISKFSKKEMDFMKDYHKTISIATGVKCGLSEDDFKCNILFLLKEDKDLAENPIRTIILDKIFHQKDELINFNVNVLLYSVLYKLINDDKSDMSKSLAKKMMYFECGLMPYDLYYRKKILNEEKVEIFEKVPDVINKFKLFRTQTYELKYIFNDIYKEKYYFENNLVNNLINLLESENHFCLLHFLIIVYNIKYILQPIILSPENQIPELIIGEQIMKMKKKLQSYIHQINLLLEKIHIKYQAFSSFENIWNLYKADYAFNSNNLITKYMLTSYYISIPSFNNTNEEYPFRINKSDKYNFELALIAYLSLYDLININNKHSKFPIGGGIHEYKEGDEINNTELKKMRASIQKNNMGEFEDNIIIINEKNLIFGIEEKNSIKVKNIHKLGVLEVCIDNSFPNSLKLYCNNDIYLIKCESDEERKNLKDELERKRNECKKLEQEGIVNFFIEEEEKINKELSVVPIPTEDSTNNNKEQKEINLIDFDNF